MKENENTEIGEIMKFGDYERQLVISNLLSRLDEIKKSAYSGEEYDLKELEGIADEVQMATTDSRLEIYVEAKVSELQGRLLERNVKYEDAKGKYIEAADKIVQWTGLTSDDLIAKSILLKAAFSLKEATEAYERLKVYIGKSIGIEGPIKALISPTTPEKSYISSKGESSAYKKVILRLVEMGMIKIPFTLTKWLGRDAVEVVANILDVALRLVNTGKMEKGIIRLRWYSI